MRLEARNLGFCYAGGPWILKDVNFSMEEGERVGLVGPSGYGKSTLVKLLAGYLEPLSLIHIFRDRRRNQDICTARGGGLYPAGMGAVPRPEGGRGVSLRGQPVYLCGRMQTLPASRWLLL